ncbi:helix-turn-helix domain-containing protein [Acetivibrio mesophilus]|uniref:XRE family transcriptional regulator n=1 Tax=Acetivibrio mesophilus TaxID=2487273 RepID=A0A4Q0I9B0_9FIRM|nr:helix-turn-helix transcriptional regulator [Acetivibrio mesophilus]ODM26309.1 XRE family transcriptional regulator [Clostridium sp. Bc-iso-3]RXE60637.1 XRE family transcriptional regulator [Acetivibrio mesophilus]HHV30363.1 helix-turn-helix transcriptional regulator [Clostridium sp.]
MEFNEKLQKLRISRNMTQEELAEQLYVSRAAISKWESGRGYPNIDSLKAISKHFNVTIDELICGEEMVSLAEEDIKETNKRHTELICGVLDCLMVLLFFIPVFGQQEANEIISVSLMSLTNISKWLKVSFVIVVSITVLNGFSAIIISNFDKPVWSRHRLASGVILLIIGNSLFVLARQPYAGVLYLSILIIKGFLLVKSK